MLFEGQLIYHRQIVFYQELLIFSGILLQRTLLFSRKSWRSWWKVSPNLQIFDVNDIGLYLLHCSKSPFLKIRIILPGIKFPGIRERLISVSIDILISLENCFKSLVGMLLGPIDLRMLRVLIMSLISFVFFGVRMKVFAAGSVR